MGWGKIKRKIGLNKLHTTKAITSATKVVPGLALIVPTKDNLKAAAEGLKVGAGAAAAVFGGMGLADAASGALAEVQAPAPGIPPLSSAVPSSPNSGLTWAGQSGVMDLSSLRLPEVVTTAGRTEGPDKMLLIAAALVVAVVLVIGVARR